VHASGGGQTLADLVGEHRCSPAFAACSIHGTSALSAGSEGDEAHVRQSSLGSATYHEHTNAHEPAAWRGLTRPYWGDKAVKLFRRLRTTRDAHVRAAHTHSRHVVLRVKVSSCACCVKDK